MAIPDHGILRRLIFPFYSLKEIAFMIILAVCTVICAMMFEFPGSSVQYAIAGYIGWVIVTMQSTPSSLHTANSNVERVEQYMIHCSLGYDSEERAWFPKFPRWLLWDRTKIELEIVDESLVVRGPYAFLRSLSIILSEPR